MRRLEKYLLIAIFGLAITLTVALAFVNRSFPGRVTWTGQNADRLLPKNFLEGKGKTLDTSTFTKTGYAIPLESDTTKSAYSSRAQLRGVVEDFDATTLKLAINEEVKTIRLPGAVRYYCAPEYFTNENGVQTPSIQVRLDFSRGQNVGTLLSADVLPKKFTKGDDITVLVNVGANDAMTAYFVAGYGCNETK